MKDSRSTKSAFVLQTIVVIAILVLLNIMAQYVFVRLDLTSEKRYSITNATQNQLENLNDIVFIRVYLDGDLPAEYLELKQATKELLDEFRAYAGSNIQYEFINPSESEDEKERVAVYQELSKQGLQYTNIRFNEGDKYSEKIIFPGAILTYQGNETPVQLLKNQLGANEYESINASIQQLEYEFIAGINKLSKKTKNRIAYIEGHSELGKLEVSDAMVNLAAQYDIERVTINGKLNALDEFDGFILAGPDSNISDKDKFIIDQFLMKGGKGFILLNGVAVNDDSVKINGTSMSMPLTVNLEDQLFKYGVRVNYDIVTDLQSLPIPVVTGYSGNKPKQEFFPWPYFPLLFSKNNHVINKNIDAVVAKYASSLDTIHRDGVKQTVLLQSSEYTKTLLTPIRVSLNMLREPLDERQYIMPPHTIAVLLEGEFNSVFKNRIPAVIENSKEINFKEKSVPSKLIVASSASIIQNEVSGNRENYYALGFDKYTNRLYGNRDFVLNAVNYLFDDNGIIEARSKEFKIRLLDKVKVKNSRLFIQTINIIAPLAFILLIALAFVFLRTKRFKN